MALYLVPLSWHSITETQMASTIGVVVGAVLAYVAWLAVATLQTTVSLALPLYHPIALTWSHVPLNKWFRALLRPLLHHCKKWQYLFSGPDMIQRGYEEAKGKPFELHAPDSRYVFVSSQEHIKALDAAPDTVLSLQAASKQMLQPKYTMHGFNWFDRRGTEGVGFVRALRTLLTHNLPQVLPDLGVTINVRFGMLQEPHPIVQNERHSPVYPMILELTVLANSLAFFGKGLAKNEAFMKSALAYIEDTLVCAEIVRLLPKFLAPAIGNIIASRLKSHEIIFNTLLPVAEERCRERELAKIGQKVPSHADCVQWIMETSPKQNPWTPKRIVHELMAIWFGSVHALSTTITFAIHDLCLHPEYVEPLREELLGLQYAAFEKSGVGLPLLDSFIKESARLTPVESMSTRRYALQPFTFSDGTKLHVGDWACTPVKALMQAPGDYPRPVEFKGFRFAPPELLQRLANSDAFDVTQPNPSKLTDVGGSFHVWGTGRMACPGRFYAAAVMKVILGQIIMSYDCRMIDPEQKRWFTWRSATLPAQNIQVVFTSRSSSKLGS